MRKLILLLLLITTLISCTTIKSHVCHDKEKPVKPSIEAVDKNGHTCFTHQDAYELYKYLRELEEGY